MRWLARWIEYRRLLREHKRLIEQRDELILQGYNPDDLDVPTRPRRPT